MDYEHDTFDLEFEEAKIHEYMEKTLDAPSFHIYKKIIIEGASVNKFLSANKRFLTTHNISPSSIPDKINDFKCKVKAYIKEHV